MNVIDAEANLADTVIRYALARWEGLTRFVGDGRSRSTPTPSNA